jgi:3-oxoacyl-[acyl-carrier-protein] synthase II
MTRAVVTRAAVATGLGPDLETTWGRLLAGDRAVRPLPAGLFDATRYTAHAASWIEGLAPAGGRSRLFPLLELLLDRLGPVPPDCRLITATTKGCIDTFERVRRGRGGDMADVPLSAPAGWLAARLGLASPGVNLNAACASSTAAVARAAALIASGRADAALVVCMDLVSEFVFSGFSALQALDPAGCRPFDRGRAGLSLGEGGAALLLVSADRARRERSPVLGTVAGWGAANDATHITAPARDGCGLAQAARQAIERAGIAPGDVAAVSAHGTGTVYNDAMELTAFRAVFGGRTLPIHSVKGAIGHTLGAAGGIEVALGLRSLSAGTLPPTAGFRDPEPGSEGSVRADAQPIAGDFLLTTNSGFGGVNAALVLERGDA